MTENSNDPIGKLRRVHLKLCHALELSEARIEDIHKVLAELNGDELGKNTVYLGDVILEQPYGAGLGPSDSGQVYQAVLIVPEGFGAVLWDMEDFRAMRNTPEAESDAVARFVRFADCGRAVKALMLPQITPLVERLSKIMPHQFD